MRVGCSPPQRRQPRRAHMVARLVTHLCAGVQPTLGYHSQRGRASGYTSYTENSVWPHFESILPGVPPPTQPPKNTTTTHADAPHYQSPPLIREIRKVGDVFTATFTLSPFPPIIISNIDLSLYSCDPLRKWFHISLNLSPTMSIKEGFGSSHTPSC